MALLGLSLAACQGSAPATTATPAAMMPGRDQGMMARHMAPIPEEYAGISNPIPADATSLQKGQALFTTNCSPCHGDRGMGDGVASPVLTPPPAPVARTSRMMGDDYLYWRISEGGAQPPFNSAMPAWKAAFSSEEIWDVINYIHTLATN